MPTLPADIIAALAPFAPLFSAPVFAHVQVLLAGAILTPGRRTVAAALRAYPRFRAELHKGGLSQATRERIGLAGPARNDAMRATFIPCSASGMAQPRITSSISFLSNCGTRSSAPRMAMAASSSGRVVRKVPLNARPTGVRTDEAITTSRIKLLRRWGFSFLAFSRSLACTEFVPGFCARRKAT